MFGYIKGVGFCARVIRKIAVCLSVLLLICAFSALFTACGGSAKDKGKYSLELHFDGESVSAVAGYSLAQADTGDKIVFCYYPAALCGGTIEKIAVNGNDVRSERSGEHDEFIVLYYDFKQGDLIEFKYNFTPEKNEGRLGVTDKTVNFALFYPVKCVKENDEYVMHEYTAIGDPFYFDFYDLEMRLFLPSTYALACGGYPEECNPQGGVTEYYYSFKNVRNVAFSISENYNVVTQKSGYKSINYYFYDDDEPENTLKEVVDAVNFFSGEIGEYAYDILTFAQSPYEYGGMEYSAFFILGEENNREEYFHAAVHETAHQWFPIAVGSDEYLRPGFDEGLAEFLTRAFIAEKDRDRAKAMYLSARESYEGYKTNCLSMGKKPLDAGNLPLCDYSSAYEYTANAYYASSCAFEQTTKMSGHLNYLSKFYGKNKFKNATESDFFDAISIFKRKAARKLLNNYV